MAKRQSSFTVPSSEVSRNINNSTFDIIKVIYDNIDNVVAAGANIVDIQTLATLDLNAIGNVSTYINDVVAVSANDQAVKDVAADINKGINSSIIAALANADRAVTAAASSEASAELSANAALKALESEAARMTAESYAIEPEDVFVKVYTSNGDGTYSVSTTTDYSALHWYRKAEGINGITLLAKADDTDAGHLQDAIASIELSQEIGRRRDLNEKYSRVGELIKTTGSQPFGDCVKANGILLLRSEFPELWEFAQNSGNIYTEEEWAKNQFLGYSYGDGSTTFRIPDWRGQFERAWDDGKGIDSNRLVGSAQADMLKKHTHPNLGLSWRNMFYAGTNRTGWYWNDSGYTTPPERSYGGPETRPKNGAVLYCIKFKD